MKDVIGGEVVGVNHDVPVSPTQAATKPARRFATTRPKAPASSSPSPDEVKMLFPRRPAMRMDCIREPGQIGVTHFLGYDISPTNT